MARCSFLDHPLDRDRPVEIQRVERCRCGVVSARELRALNLARSGDLPLDEHPRSVERHA